MPTNALLETFPAEARQQINAHAVANVLRAGDGLATAGEPCHVVYFPTTAVVSLIASAPDGRSVESMLVDRFGAVGLLAALGSGVSEATAIVRSPGSALKVEASLVRRLAGADAGLYRVTVGTAQRALATVQQTATCAAVHSLDARLARWLLEHADAVEGPLLAVTQDQIAGLLGVQRTSVTAAARGMQTQCLIGYRRGEVRILDRTGLERAACDCYRRMRAPPV